jgi:hypothetical protein
MATLATAARLRENFERCRDMDGSLNKRLLALTLAPARSSRNLRSLLNG